MVHNATGHVITAKKCHCDTLYYFHLERLNSAGDIMTGTVITPRKLDINHAHEIYGHADIRMVQRATQDANIELTGTFKICPSCQIAKAKRKTIPRMTLVTASYPGERFFIDIAGPFPEGLNSYRYWAIFVDHYSRKKFSILLTKKSALGKEAGKFLDYLKTLGK
jgi:hypothetical protein